MKKIKREALTKMLREKAGNLPVNQFLVTSYRPVANGALMIEVCQSRNVSQRKETLLGVLNKSDERFRSPNTLLFDWLTFKPADLVAAMPDVKHSVETLSKIADSYDPNSDDVFADITIINNITTPSGKKTPVIVVTEVTESELSNFFRGKDSEERIKDTIENERRIMKTGSDDDADYLVHPESGDKIYRFTRTEFAENKPQDTLIAGKITLAQYEKDIAKQGVKAESNDLNAMFNITGGNSI